VVSRLVWDIRTVSDLGTQPLPFGWTCATLEELAAPERHPITDGPFGSNLKPEHYTPSGPRVIRLQNIGDGIFVDAEAHISQAHFETLAKHQVEADDIVIAALGETLPRSCVIPASVGPAIVKADCIRFRPDSRLALPKYLNFMINAEQTRRWATTIIHGVGRPRMNLQEIKSITLPLPPLNEQHRIVAAIETQFTRLDAAVAALERSRANLKRYRAAVLKAACEGRLVPTEAELARTEGRGYESADGWLRRTLDQRRQEWELAGRTRNGRYSEPALPPGVGGAGLPEGWAWASVEQLNSPNRPCAYGVLQPGPDVDNGIPFVRVGDVDEGRIDLTNLKRIAPVVAAQYPRTRLAGGEVLITLVGTIGRTAVVPQALAGANTARAVGVMPLIEGVPPTWVELWFRNPSLSAVEGMEKAIDANLKRAGRLRQAILARAFAGKLVPQDPADEPASVLLERIRAERPDDAGKTRTRRARPKQPQLL
jgi:type I restriction enzyme S subunit